MYGKIFESIFKSTLVAEGGWLPTYIFMSMITLADKDGIVDFASKSLYSHLGFRNYDSKITYDDFNLAIEYLEKEDPDSNSAAENGRRIVPLREIDSIDGNRGWLVVNYLEYRKKASGCEPSGASTERVRAWRERQKKRDVTGCNGDETGCNGHTDTDTDTDTEKKNNKKKKIATTPPNSFPVTDQMKEYAAKKGYVADLEDLTEGFLIHHRAKNTKWVDWYAAWQKWLRNQMEWHPERNVPPGTQRAGPEPKTYAQNQDAERRGMAQMAKELKRRRLEREANKGKDSGRVDPLQLDLPKPEER